MINYVSSGGELVDRALQSVLTCYGASYQRHTLPTLPDWKLDELLCDRQVHALMSECDPLKFHLYLDRLPIKIDTRAHWWQVLPPCHKQIQKIVSLVAGFNIKYKYLKHSFFLSKAYEASVWKTIFSKVEPHILKAIDRKDILFRLADVDLHKLNYTYYNRQVRSCLIYPRSDRQTNAKVSDLLLTVSHIHPYFYY